MRRLRRHALAPTGKRPRAAANAATRAGSRFAGKIPWPRVGKWGALALLAALVLPVLEVGCVRFVNPPGTPLMALRHLEARLGGRTPPPVRFRWLPWRALPDDFLRAIWAAEDARFFKHHGFDWIEFHTAMAQAERTGTSPRGISTITMQCARSLFLWQGHSYVRKGLEAYYTFWMEALLPKRRIFELYANVIELGDGVYGVNAASERWYRKPASQLSSDECVALATLPGAPRRWNPHAPSRRYRGRQARAARELPLMRWPTGVR